LSKTAGIASYFEEFANEASVKDGLKLRCQNVKLFLREPLVSEDSVIVSHPGSGTLIITDFLPNIQRLRKIIEAMDVPRVREEISIVGE